MYPQVAYAPNSQEPSQVQRFRSITPTRQSGQMNNYFPVAYEGGRVSRTLIRPAENFRSSRIVSNQNLQSQLSEKDILKIADDIQHGNNQPGLSHLPPGVNPIHKFNVKVLQTIIHKQIPIQEQILVQTQPQYSPQRQEDCAKCPFYEGRIRELEDKIENLLSEIERLSCFVQQKSEETDQWKNQLRNLEMQKGDYNPSQAQLDELRSIYIQSQNEKDSYYKQLLAINRQLEDVSNVLRQKDSELLLFKSKNQNNTHHEQELRELRQSHIQIKMQHDEQVQIAESLRRKCEYLTTEIQNLQIKFNQQESRQFSLNNNENESLKAELEMMKQRANLELNRMQGEIRQKDQMIITLESQQQQNNHRERDEEIRMLQFKFEQQMGQKDLKINQLNMELQRIQLKLQHKEEEQITFNNQFKTFETTIQQMTIQNRQLVQRIEIMTINVNDNQGSHDSIEILKAEINRLKKIVVELRTEIDRLLVKGSDNNWLNDKLMIQQKELENLKTRNVTTPQILRTTEKTYYENNNGQLQLPNGNNFTSGVGFEHVLRQSRVKVETIEYDYMTFDDDQKYRSDRPSYNENDKFQQRILTVPNTTRNQTRNSQTKFRESINYGDNLKQSGVQKDEIYSFNNRNDNIPTSKRTY